MNNSCSYKIAILSSNINFISLVRSVIDKFPFYEAIVVESIDEYVESIKNKSFAIAISDYIFDGYEIFRVAALAKTKKLEKNWVPIYVITEKQEPTLPACLAREYGIKEIPLSIFEQIISSKESLDSDIKGMSLHSVLIIEDDYDASEIAKLSLKIDFDIDIASDGVQGLNLWKEKRHDIILLDYMLPGMNGDAILSEVMTIDSDQAVIILTAFDKPEFNKDFILNGASQYLPKPYQINDLRSACYGCLVKSKLNKINRYSEIQNRDISLSLADLEAALLSGNVEHCFVIINNIKNFVPNYISDDILSTLYG
ncbi:response regulator [Methylomonas sp. AM2-LC]|uniref:response regulator n=1 Tax=Methylomonas sp. AM2-LC TaxID=3153301 RepID=UPI003265A16E